MLPYLQLPQSLIENESRSPSLEMMNTNYSVSLWNNSPNTINDQSINNDYRHFTVQSNNNQAVQQQQYYQQLQQPNNNNNNALNDPHSFSQHQYQLKCQQLILLQQQQQQYQSISSIPIIQQLQPLMISQPIDLTKNSSNNPSVARTSIEKIFLNSKFVTMAVFQQLSDEIPRLGPHDAYEGFFVCPNPTGYEWDLVLKVFYKNDKENKTYIRYYLVHEAYALRGDRCSDALVQVKQERPDCVQIELEVPYVLFIEFDHIISYMYGSDICIGDSHLISLYVLIERLKINGGLLESTLHEIRRYCDKYHCVSYLLKAEELLSEDLVWLCGDAILQNLATIAYHEWLSIPITAFTRLIYQAISGGIAKYSEYIVCELIVEYIKAIMSDNHKKAKHIIKHLDTTDVSHVSLKHSLPIIKIVDILFSEKKQLFRYNNIHIYKLSINKIKNEYTPYHQELNNQLQGLSPIAFSHVLIYSKHLQKEALNLSLMAYKEGNHAAYFNDKRLKISYILKQRITSAKQSKNVKSIKMGAVNDKENDMNKINVPKYIKVITIEKKDDDFSLKGEKVTINGIGDDNDDDVDDDDVDDDDIVVVDDDDDDDEIIPLYITDLSSIGHKESSKSPAYSITPSYDYSSYNESFNNSFSKNSVNNGDINENQSPLTKRNSVLLSHDDDDT